MIAAFILGFTTVWFMSGAVKGEPLPPWVSPPQQLWVSPPQPWPSPPPPPASPPSQRIVRDGSSIFITGFIEQDDYIRFVELVDDDVTTVFLSSRGGYLNSALRIADLIRTRRYATIVPPGATCVSACVVLWVAGSPRELGVKARLGIHCGRLKGSDDCDNGANRRMVTFMRYVRAPENLIEIQATALEDMVWITEVVEPVAVAETVPVPKHRPPVQHVGGQSRSLPQSNIEYECAGYRSVPPEAVERDPVVKTSVTMPSFGVTHSTLAGEAYARVDQYRNVRTWSDRNGDYWSGVSIKNPRRTMVGQLAYDDRRGIAARLYVEKSFIDGRLERTTTATCVMSSD